MGEGKGGISDGPWRAPKTPAVRSSLRSLGLGRDHLQPRAGSAGGSGAASNPGTGHLRGDKDEDGLRPGGGSGSGQVRGTKVRHSPACVQAEPRSWGQAGMLVHGQTCPQLYRSWKWAHLQCSPGRNWGPRAEGVGPRWDWSRWGLSVHSVPSPAQGGIWLVHMQLFYKVETFPSSPRNLLLALVFKSLTSATSKCFSHEMLLLSPKTSEVSIDSLVPFINRIPVSSLK